MLFVKIYILLIKNKIMLKENLKKLESSKTFKDWFAKNKNCHLSHIFFLLDREIQCQIGYYNPEDNLVTTFAISDEIIQNPPEEVFKDEESIMKSIDMKKVKTDVEGIMKIADSLQKEKYKGHNPIKKIAILQHLEVGQVWNITFVTNKMETLNIKIDSATGKVVSDKLVSLFEFRK